MPFHCPACNAEYLTPEGAEECAYNDNGEVDDSPVIEYTSHDKTHAEFLELIRKFNIPDAGNSGTH